MDDVTALRDALVTAYDAVERPWSSDSFAGLMDDLIAAAEARAIEGSGVVEALVEATSLLPEDAPEPGPYPDMSAVWYERGWDDRGDAILAALPRPDEPSPDRMAGLLARTYALLPPDRVLLVDDEVHEVVARYLDALPRPEEPRVERCAFVWKSGTPCGKPKRDSRHKHDSSCLTGGEGHITDMLCHPYTPEAR